MTNELEYRKYNDYKDPYKKHHKDIQNSHLYSRLLDLFRDFDTKTDHVNELADYLLSADIEWNEAIDKDNHMIERYLSDNRLSPYYGVLSQLLFDLSSKFKMAEIEFPLPSTAIDDEFNELELYWNVKEFKLLIIIEVDTTEVNAILYYHAPHKTYCFEFDTDIENISNQIIAVIKSTQ